jgi:hypothetical protein
MALAAQLTLNIAGYLRQIECFATSFDDGKLTEMAEKLCRILTTEALHAQRDASGATAVKLPAWLSLDLKMRMEMAEKLYRVLTTGVLYYLEACRASVDELEF